VPPSPDDDPDFDLDYAREEKEYEIKDVMTSTGYQDIENLPFYFGDSKSGRSFKDRFVNQLDDRLAQDIEESKNNWKLRYEKVDASVFLVGKEEGFKERLSHQQNVSVEIAGASYEARVYAHGTDNQAIKFDDPRAENPKFAAAATQLMRLNFYEEKEFLEGGRFLLKVDGRVDGVGYFG